MTDLYAVLEVTPTVSATELDHAFRTLARRHHPDTGDGDNERLRQVLDAYAVLRDPAARAAYDRKVIHPEPPKPKTPDIRVGPVHWRRSRG